MCSRSKTISTGITPGAIRIMPPTRLARYLQPRHNTHFPRDTITDSDPKRTTSREISPPHLAVCGSMLLSLRHRDGALAVGKSRYFQNGRNSSGVSCKATNRERPSAQWWPHQRSRYELFAVLDGSISHPASATRGPRTAKARDQKTAQLGAACRKVAFYAAISHSAASASDSSFGLQHNTERPPLQCALGPQRSY